MGEGDWKDSGYRRLLGRTEDPPPLLGDNRLHHKLAIARAGAICEC